MKDIDLTHWQARLDRAAQQTGVVGAVLGVLRLREGQPDELVRWATGLLNATTGRGTTVDSLFQIGSITKMWTATVIMQLVEEGRLGLDQRVTDVLPDFTFSTGDLTDNVTIRHLLTHTSGLDGDLFVDTGRGDDNLAKYMEVLQAARQIYPVGAMWSYCNSGFSLLGRIIEVVTGQVWDAAIRERLFAPLGLTHTVTLPEEALLFDTAVGHVVGLPTPEVTPVWGLQRNAGPAGLITASVADLLTFARLHLRDGVTADGKRLLGAESAQAMRAWSVDATGKYPLADSWGLGFMRFDWHGAELFGHDGQTLGQTSFLRVYPEADMAVALLTNDSAAFELSQVIFGELFGELCGVTISNLREPPHDPPKLEVGPWVGTYERAELVIDIVDDPDGPWLTTTARGELADLDDTPVRHYRMVPARDGLYFVVMDQMHLNVPVWLSQLGSGERYVHLDGRAARKVS